MSLFFRLLELLPPVQRLQTERDGLRSEQNSIKLKLRAASAEMGVLEEQLRVMQKERDQLVKEVAGHKAEHGSQAARLNAATAASEALKQERDSLLNERQVRAAQDKAAQDKAAQTERERLAKAPDNRRQAAGPG